MAAEDRPTRDYLSLAQQAAAAPESFDLFALVRGLSARAPEKLPVGTSKLPSQDIVRLHQVPHLVFPAPTIKEVTIRDGRPHLGGYWLGLTGPMSPLPLHLTEYAVFERRYADQHPFGDFLDMIAGRFLQLFYRSWEVTRPAVQADRPDSDQFSVHVAQLTGAQEGADEDSAFTPALRLHYAGLFASRRSAGAIEGALRHLLGLPVAINEFRPNFAPVLPADQSSLGRRHSLIGEAVLGRRAFFISDTFEVRITARNMAQFERLQPGTRLFRLVGETLDALGPSELEWYLTLALPSAEVRGVRLDGKNRLGWSSWLGDGKAGDGSGGGAERGDVHLRRSAMQRGRPANDVSDRVVATGGK
ncbi:MAG: type VI secretion system baseplate subunit TssG [Erythrobacter sp.]|jgi:type VI secretion system protein ImpH|nr:type VI secretion system baseplate subunit TssG [Erythrobacter sp.]